MKPSTGAAVRDHRNAVRDRSESLSAFNRIAVRNRRNPHKRLVKKIMHLDADIFIAIKKEASADFSHY